MKNVKNAESVNHSLIKEFKGNIRNFNRIQKTMPVKKGYDNEGYSHYFIDGNGNISTNMEESRGIYEY